MSLYSFEDRHGNVAIHAWETFTGNGRGMDEDDREQAMKSCRDAATNAYVDGIDDGAWLTATLALLGVKRAA